jgi:hypothetical protein
LRGWLPLPSVKRSPSDRFDRSAVPKHLLIVLAGHTSSLAY